MPPSLDFSREPIGMYWPIPQDVAPRPGAAFGPCDCCQVLDGNAGGQPVTYCPRCDAWLCEGCRENWWRRGRAFLATKGLVG